MKKARAKPRTVARLAAVQALYQLEASGGGVEDAIRQFQDHRFDRDLEDGTMAPADEAYFARLVRQVVARQGDIDAEVSARLAEGWRLERIDATARAILRCATAELDEPGDTPVEVILDEYVEIAKSFFAGPEVSFINAALDAQVRGAGAG